MNMDQTKETLQKLSLSEKEIVIYLTLLSTGPSSIRKISELAKINRGTTHDALRSLQGQGLVSYYHKEKKQYFVAEDPIVINSLLKNKKDELAELEEDLKDSIPQLRTLFTELDERPTVKYYDNLEGVRTILQDVLNTTASKKPKEYAVYSSSKIKPYLYKTFENYTEERIKRKISVRAIAIGPGGKESGLDKRKWLTTEEAGAPTYTFLYGGKMAMISVDKRDVPHGVVIEDQHIYDTQLLVFNWIWEKLR